MAKLRAEWECSNCGKRHPKMAGRCGPCGSLGTIHLIDEPRQHSAGSPHSFAPLLVAGLRDSCNTPPPRIQTGLPSLDQALGGGLVPGSTTVLGGPPGIGKSTLTLQMLASMASAGVSVLYTSGEEGRHQVADRYRRLAPEGPNVLFAEGRSVNGLAAYIAEHRPDVVVVDSVQTMTDDTDEGIPGGVRQLASVGNHLRYIANATGVAFWIIGQVTKTGDLAGPMALSHLVDTVLEFGTLGTDSHRLLRVTKNRNGSTEEIAVFTMTEGGLVEAADPSDLLLRDRAIDCSGSALAVTLEGSRGMLFEVQALVTPAAYGTPQRSATGYPKARLTMLTAVLEKRCHFPFGTMDVAVNIAGGYQVTDTAVDLAVTAAMLSSLREMPLPWNAVFAGEVGLAGEVRSTGRLARRMGEAARLGFNRGFGGGEIVARDAPGVEWTPVRGVLELAEVVETIYAA